VSTFKHWTIRYIYNRVIYAVYKKLYPDHPWLTQMSIKILDSWLKPSDMGFEWGCGRSTLWFAKRVYHLTSIEHDKMWFSRIKATLAASQIKNVELLFRNRSGGKHSEYVRSINFISNNSLDFVLVDGRMRAYCMAEALDKIRPGGLLILDNAEKYMPSSSCAPGARTDPEFFKSTDFLPKLHKWRSIWTSNGIWDTVLWVKPSGK
jgi:hypothetical protein